MSSEGSKGAVKEKLHREGNKGAVNKQWRSESSKEVVNFTEGSKKAGAETWKRLGSNRAIKLPSCCPAAAGILRTAPAQRRRG